MSIIYPSYPGGWSNPVNFRVSAALAGAGAWDATPLEFPAAYADNLTLSFTYTRGGAGGAFDWQMETSAYGVAANVPAGASEWVTQPIYDSGAVAAGADTQSRVQREYQTYQATAAGAEDFHFGPISLAGTVERIRIRARESGNVGAPGALQISGVML